MYEDRKETFSIRDLLIQLLFIILLVFILIWLFPTKGYLEKKLDGIESGLNEKLQPLYTRLFTDNILTMKDAAKSYFTTPRLPQKVGDKVTMTLSEMYEKGLLLELVDSNNNSCDATKSYIELVKTEEEYQMKVTLSCSDKEAYVIEYMGCYDYCNGLLCTKEESKQNQTKVDPTSDPKPTPTPVVVKKYEYQYVKTEAASCSGYGKFGEWTTNKIEENNTTKVETKTEKVLDHYEQVYKVVDTKYVDQEYYEDVNYGYSTKTVKKTATYDYTTETTTTILSFATRTYRTTATYDYIYEKTATGTKWVDAGTKSSEIPLTDTSTTKYIRISAPTDDSCVGECLEKDYYYYKVQKLQATYTTTKKCPEGTNENETKTGCIVSTDTTEKYCPQGDPTDSGCVIVNTKKYCAVGEENAAKTGCEVVTYEKQQYCALNGKDNATKTGCVLKVKKTKKVAELVYGYVDGDPVYNNVTYYRSATRTCKDATTDYKWSTSDNDATLKSQGYTLTGVKREI